MGKRRPIWLYVAREVTSVYNPTKKKYFVIFFILIFIYFLLENQPKKIKEKKFFIMEFRGLCVQSAGRGCL